MPQKKKRQESANTRSGASRQLSSAQKLQSKGQEFNQYGYAPTTPDIDQSQVRFGDVTQGRSANLIGGTNTAAALADVLSQTVNLGKTVADGAAQIAEMHDREMEEDLQAELQRGQKMLDEGGMTASEYEGYAAKTYADFRDKSWTKRNTIALDAKQWESQMKVRPLSYEETKVKANIARNAIINREYENEDDRADDLVAWAQTWEPRLSQIAGDNEALKDDLLALVTGVDTETHNARFKYVNNYVTTQWGDVDRHITEWIDKTMRDGGQIPGTVSDRIQSFNDYMIDSNGLPLFDDPDMGQDAQTLVMERLERRFARKAPMIDDMVNTRRKTAVDVQMGTSIDNFGKKVLTPHHDMDLDEATDELNGMFQSAAESAHLGDFASDTQLATHLTGLRDTYLLGNSWYATSEEAEAAFMTQLKQSLLGSNLPEGRVDRIVEMVTETDIKLDDRVDQMIGRELDHEIIEYDERAGTLTVGINDIRKHRRGITGMMPEPVRRARIVDMTEEVATATTAWVGRNLPELLDRSRRYNRLEEPVRMKVRAATIEILDMKAHGKTPEEIREAIGHRFDAHGHELNIIMDEANKVHQHPLIRSTIDFNNVARKAYEGQWDPEQYSKALERLEGQYSEGNGFAPDSTGRMTLGPLPDPVADARDAVRKGGDTLYEHLANNHTEFVRGPDNPIESNEEGIQNLMGLRETHAWEAISHIPQTGEKHYAFVRSALGMNVTASQSRRILTAMRQLDGSEDPEVRAAAMAEITEVVNGARLNDMAGLNGRVQGRIEDLAEIEFNSSAERQAYGLLFQRDMTVSDVFESMQFPDMETRNLVMQTMLDRNSAGNPYTIDDIKEVFDSVGLRIEHQSTTIYKNDNTTARGWTIKVNLADGWSQEDQGGRFAATWGYRTNDMHGGTQQWTVRDNLGTKNRPSYFGIGLSRQAQRHVENEGYKEHFDSEPAGNMFLEILDFNPQRFAKKDAEGAPVRGQDIRILSMLKQYKGASEELRPKIMQELHEQGMPRELVHILGTGVEDISQGITQRDLAQMFIHLSAIEGNQSLMGRDYGADFEYTTLPSSNGVSYSVQFPNQENYIIEAPWGSSTFSLFDGPSPTMPYDTSDFMKWLDTQERGNVDNRMQVDASLKREVMENKLRAEGIDISSSNVAEDGGSALRLASPRPASHGGIYPFSGGG